MASAVLAEVTLNPSRSGAFGYLVPGNLLMTLLHMNYIGNYGKIQIIIPNYRVFIYSVLFRTLFSVLFTTFQCKVGCFQYV